MFFMTEDTRTCKNEFTSECRLQTRLTICAKTAAYSLFCWPPVFYPDKSLIRTAPLRLSRRSHHLSTSSFNALCDCITWCYQRCDLLSTAAIPAASCGCEYSGHTGLLRVCFPELTIMFQEHNKYIYKYYYSGRSISLGIFYIPTYDLLFLLNISITRCALL